MSSADDDVRERVLEDAPHACFPSIEQFRDFRKSLERLYAESPRPRELTLRGTVKLHGTHGDIVLRRRGDAGVVDCCVQSRNRVLTVESDNMGFAAFVASIPFAELLAWVEGALGGAAWTEAVVAGEFCGGNLQKGVALSQLPRMFVVFGVRLDGRWLDMDALAPLPLELEAEGRSRVYDIRRCPAFEVRFDPADPDAALPRLQALTDAVERECPFAKTFGVSGTGEGVVWKCVDAEPGACAFSRYWFKVKGEQHAATRVRAPRAGASETQQQDAAEFARIAGTENRLLQGLEYLREMGLPSGAQSMGVFIKWVVEDALREERLALEETGLPVPAVRKELTSVARQWFLMERP